MNNNLAVSAKKWYDRITTSLIKRTRLAAGQLISPLYIEPGHYLSPIAGPLDTERALRNQPECLGINLRADDQVSLMKELATYWEGLPEEPTSGWRYHTSVFFAPRDATVYFALLQHLRPKQVVEVGSGFTSALALDVKGRLLPDLKLTFIDPHPHRLYNLLGETDRSSCEIHAVPVQDLPLDFFDTLRSGDFLFLDTSHVSKQGSDVNWIVFNVLPRLSEGVIVHIHDIFWPLEYPKQWLSDHRSWSEIYLARSLLMFNTRFEILLFNDWMWRHHPEMWTTLEPEILERSQQPVVTGP